MKSIKQEQRGTEKYASPPNRGSTANTPNKENQPHQDLSADRLLPTANQQARNLANDLTKLK
ncbi:MAG: hypothetical protein HWD62_11820 [Cyclobacteriaceae bacterium]|nr:MAG: hypothetical protein HWD62_11820 [Cyclobacteriaceae bacterium]